MLHDMSYADLESDRQTMSSLSAEIRADHVFRLWNTEVDDAVSAFAGQKAYLWSGAEPPLGIAAVLPGQPLELGQLDALEAAGLLVIEVPEQLRHASTALIAQYLSDELRQLDAATSTHGQPEAVLAADLDDIAQGKHLGPEKQQALLDLLNQPDTVDGLW